MEVVQNIVVEFGISEVDFSGYVTRDSVGQFVMMIQTL
jgi:hypothetical protein